LTADESARYLLRRETGASALSPTQYSLRFISGKYQGGEFPIRMERGRDIVIGRSSDLDMVLVEDMVSRKHAKIVPNDGELVIEDLDSTNGTFVNGEKIRRARLKEGDRILIGTSIIKLVNTDGTTAVSEADARKRLEQAGSRRVTNAGLKPMSGSIDEIPLPDLMQLLSTSRKSGVLVVRTDFGEGRLYFRKGQVYYATIDDSFDIPPRKAIYRMLTWTSGAFELDPPDDKEVLEEISDPTESLLMEGLRQLDEVERIRHELPDRNALVGLNQPLHSPLRDLTPAELDTLQLAINHPRVQTLIDRSERSDFETYETLRGLIAREYLVVRPG
jgi:pSer/pThr/pTyr-binding forkhead associated (FHA) protein